MKLIRTALVLALPFGLFGASTASADTLGACPGGSTCSSLNLSLFSSEPATNPASELDALLQFEFDGTDLILHVTNQTNSGTPTQADPAYNVSQVYFNLTTDITSIALSTVSDGSNWTDFLDACPVGSGTTGIAPCNDMGGINTKANGFGIFDVAIKADSNADQIDPGASVDFTFSVTGSNIDASDFTAELSRDSEAGGLILSLAAGRFTMRDPLLPDPNAGFDSAFGAVPEPSTALLLGLGLGGLTLASGRRRRG